MLRISFLIFFLFSQITYADSRLIPLPLINRDDNLLKLDTRNLKIFNTASNLETQLIGKVSWERTKQNLLLPFIKLRLKSLKDQKKQLHYRYKGIIYLPQELAEFEFTDLDISIFDPEKIEVYQGGSRIGDVGLKITPDDEKDRTVLLDYSCSGYNLQVSKFDGEFLSVGCEMQKQKIDNKIIPFLKVNWISSEYKTLDKHNGPYVIYFSEGRLAKIKVINEEGVEKEIVFKVDFPKTYPKLRTAIGFGPYSYEAGLKGKTNSAEILPSAMIYGNYYINDIHSFKFFDALVVKESLFNHAGTYIGSDIGKFYDDRVVISTLIGLQALSYKYDAKEKSTFTQVIYPQGAEISMHHPFGLENYKFIVGGFLSPQSNVTYQNFWARFGSKVFLEFNYINWQYSEKSAKMYGLTIGMPLWDFH